MTVNPLPAGSQLLVVGGGYCGSRLGRRLQELGARVITTRRNPKTESGELAFNSDGGPVPSNEALAGTTHVLITAPPDREGRDPCLKALQSQLRQLELQWVGYLSTTGVYGDHQGVGWMKTMTRPRKTAAPKRCAPTL